MLMKSYNEIIWGGASLLPRYLPIKIKKETVEMMWV